MKKRTRAAYQKPDQEPAPLRKKPPRTSPDITNILDNLTDLITLINLPRRAHRAYRQKGRTQ